MNQLPKEQLIEAVKEARAKSKERKFTQSVDCTLNFKEIDFKKPEKRVSVDIVLPHGRGKEVKVALFARKALAEDCKGKVDTIITEDELNAMKKKKAKEVANSFDKFVSETTLMATVGKQLGTILGPRQKMPTPSPPDAKAIPVIVERVKKTVTVSNKAKGDYFAHVAIGSDKLTDEQLAENLQAVLNAVTGKLEKGYDNIKTAYVKTTMGPAIDLEQKVEKAEKVNPQ